MGSGITLILRVNLGRRIIEQDKPTLLLDEADSYMGKNGNDDLRGILNSGHKRSGAYILRTVGEKHEPKQFSTWAPMALAGIGKTWETLQDRSIVIKLRRKAAGESVTPMRESKLKPELEPIRRQLARWSTDYLVALDVVQDCELPMPPAFINRLGDNWRPLFAVASLCGTSDKVRAAALSIVENDDPSESADVILLADIRDIFSADGGPFITSKDLAKKLAEIEGRPWAEWKNGKPITATALAHRLNPFCIRSASNGHARGYRLESFADTFERYLPATTPAQSVKVSETQQGRGFPGDSETSTPETIDTLKKPANPHKHGTFDTLTLPTGGTGADLEETGVFAI